MNVAYFDYNATHPPFLDILESSINYYSENFFNPSGPSRFSLNNQSQIESARIYFSKLTNKDKNDFVFSSTGTEANFFLLNLIKKRHEDILISPFEHSSIYESIHDLKIQFRILKTDKSGLIDLDDLEKKFKVKNSPLILIYAGNETGVIQPILEAKKILGNFPIYSDLMQAFGKIHVQFDLLSGFSFSGHKIGAGLGASLTYVENLEKDFGIFKGGNQENSHRAGTENFVSIDVFKNSSIRQLENLDIIKIKLNLN
jgi:cysteine desulfurase